MRLMSLSIAKIPDSRDSETSAKVRHLSTDGSVPRTRILKSQYMNFLNDYSGVRNRCLRLRSGSYPPTLVTWLCRVMQTGGSASSLRRQSLQTASPAGSQGRVIPSPITHHPSPITHYQPLHDLLHLQRRNRRIVSTLVGGLLVLRPRNRNVVIRRSPLIGL